MKRTLILTKACLLAAVLLPACNDNSTNTETASVASMAQANKPETAQKTGDLGKTPWALNIEKATINNTNYRDTKWTGDHLQMVLMSLKPGEEIDLEVHPNVDQFIRIEQGEAQVRMGKAENELTFDQKVSDDWAVLIPAGYYHHIKNTGKEELKLYSIYTPAEHPSGTRHKTYKEAQEYGHNH